MEQAARAVPLIEARETTTNDETESSTNATTTVQVTNIDAVDLQVDASVGSEVCVAACEVTCNSTVLALIQSECLDKCVRERKKKTLFPISGPLLCSLDIDG